jgi:hypothetical protein
MRWNSYESPFGPLTLIAGETGLRAVHFPGRGPKLDPAKRDPDALRGPTVIPAQSTPGDRPG